MTNNILMSTESLVWMLTYRYIHLLVRNSNGKNCKQGLKIPFVLLPFWVIYDAGPVDILKSVLYFTCFSHYLWYAGRSRDFVCFRSLVWYQIWAIVSNMSLNGINGTRLFDPFIVARSKLLTLSETYVMIEGNNQVQLCLWCIDKLIIWDVLKNLVLSGHTHNLGKGSVWIVFGKILFAKNCM